MKKLCWCSALTIFSIFACSTPLMAISEDHPLLSRLRTSAVACPSDPQSIELLAEDGSHELTWLEKGYEGDEKTGSGGFGLDHIIYHETYDFKKEQYNMPSTHLLDIAKRLSLLSEEDKNIKFNFLTQLPGNRNVVNQYKTVFVPKYKDLVLQAIKNIIETGKKIPSQTILRHEEYDLDTESQKTDEGWVYTDGKVVIFVRSNGFIANVFPKNKMKKGFIKVITDGDEPFQEKYGSQEHTSVISLKKEYKDYLTRHQRSGLNFASLTLKQYSDYKSKYAHEMDVMFYNKIISLREFKNPEDFFEAVDLGFKCSAEYYIWNGSLTKTRVVIQNPVEYIFNNPPKIKQKRAYYKRFFIDKQKTYEMFKSFTGRQDLTYEEYCNIILLRK